VGRGAGPADGCAGRHGRCLEAPLGALVPARGRTLGGRLGAVAHPFGLGDTDGSPPRHFGGQVPALLAAAGRARGAAGGVVARAPAAAVAARRLRRGGGRYGPVGRGLPRRLLRSPPPPHGPGVARPGDLAGPGSGLRDLGRAATAGRGRTAPRAAVVRLAGRRGQGPGLVRHPGPGRLGRAHLPPRSPHRGRQPRPLSPNRPSLPPVAGGRGRLRPLDPRGARARAARPALAGAGGRRELRQLRVPAGRDPAASRGDGSNNASSGQCPGSRPCRARSLRRPTWSVGFSCSPASGPAAGCCSCLR